MYEGQGGKGLGQAKPKAALKGALCPLWDRPAGPGPPGWEHSLTWAGSARRQAGCQAQNGPGASDGHGASFQRPLIIQRNSLSVCLFPVPPPMHSTHTCTTRANTRTTHAGIPPCSQATHVRTHTRHTGSAWAHTHTAHSCHMHAHGNTHRHVRARVCQSDSHPMKGDKRGPWSCSKHPKRRSSPLQPPGGPQPGSGSPFLCLGRQFCQPGTSPVLLIPIRSSGWSAD